MTNIVMGLPKEQEPNSISPTKVIGSAQLSRACWFHNGKPIFAIEKWRSVFSVKP